jgi:hypothetical protein
LPELKRLRRTNTDQTLRIERTPTSDRFGLVSKLACTPVTSMTLACYTMHFCSRETIILNMNEHSVSVFFNLMPLAEPMSYANLLRKSSILWRGDYHKLILIGRARYLIGFTPSGSYLSMTALFRKSREDGRLGDAV